MLLNYHIGRFVLGSLCVGDLVRLGWSSVRVAGCMMSLAILFHFLRTQHVSDINISIIWSRLQPATRTPLKPQPATRTPLKPSRTKSPTHNEPRTKRPMW